MAANTTPLPPHPKDYPILGSVPAFVRDTPQTFVDGWREVGDVVLFRGLRTMTLASHPDFAKHVLADRSENYPRSERVVEKLSVLMGDSIFTTEGETWRRQARLVHPVLHGERIASFASAITDAADETATRWDAAASTGTTVDLLEETTRLSLDAAARILFGSDRGGDFEALVEHATVASEYAIAGVMAVGGPPDVRIRPAFRRYLASVGYLRGLVQRAIDVRRRRPGNDFISALVEARDGEATLSDEQVRDEALTFLTLNYAGMSCALVWAWYVLATEPAVGERLRDELAASGGANAPTLESAARLPYLDLMLKELLRLYPPLWVFARVALADDILGGYRIPRGMSVVLCPWITHRHPEFWPNPETFDPDRFAGADAPGGHPFAYFPWAGGPRGCPAEGYGTMFAKVVLASLARRFQADLVPGHTIKRVREFVLRPSNGLPAQIVSARRQAS